MRVQVDIEAAVVNGLDADDHLAIAERAAGAGEALADAPMVSNLRHVGLLERARASVRHASDSVGKMGRLASEEFVLADLQSARSALEEVTGARTPDDVLVHIFSRFCVGK